ncbi:MAG: glutamine-hydrolyzing carbamoyl-phosphate synthase small subunit [Treponema sp.]|nr:glutamine-hydrolyzing carbamoyl-phosphate synthase small subunit [Treponema sp.]
MKNKPAIRHARLVLEDGSEYSGFHFGKARSQAGEVVFSTAMSGYAQMLSDPSYRGQILVATCPLMGNTGIPVKRKNREPELNRQGIPLHLESGAVQVSGFVVAEACEQPSHYSSGATLSSWLEKNNIPGVYGIDTRALAIRLSTHGIMRGKILVEGSRDVTFDSGVIQHPVAEVSCSEVKVYTPFKEGEFSKSGAPVKIALIDCGLKAGLLRYLLSRNAEVTCLPWNHDLKGQEYDGLLISSGPGDPKACGKIIATVRQAFDRKKPVFGIGLGSQIMALAAGGDTYRLSCGHYGHNLPCIEVKSQTCYITSQNHSYSVRAESLPSGWEPWFINANDGSIEGIRSVRRPFSAVQFYPEGQPGPFDALKVLDAFLKQAEDSKR